MSHMTHSRARLGLRVFSPAAALALATLTGSTMTVWGPSQAHAKTPGARYCFSHACHRVMTLAQTRAAVGKSNLAVTSFYDDCRRDRYNPCGLTSSGEAYRPGESNSAASPIYPDGTVVLVRNPRNGEAAIVRINNAGPYWGNRTLDLSRAAGTKLGLDGVGVAKVELTVLRAPTAIEARYRKGRRYPPVPGHVGSFASLGEAQVFAALKLDLPGAIGEDMIALAQAAPRITTVSPVGFAPIATAPREYRRPAAVTHVSQLEPAIVVSKATEHVAARLQASGSLSPSLLMSAVEISDVSLLVPPVGETARVGRTQKTDNEPGLSRLAAVSAATDAMDGLAALTLVQLPALAARGVQGWYRRAQATVSHVIAFAPANLITRQTRIARWAALQFALLNSERGEVAGTPRDDGGGTMMLWSDDDRVSPVTRRPARARSDDFYGLAA